jgi:YD repeat-containing protein
MARTAPVPNIPPIPGMCPSIAVLGGGGDGGGGGAGGAGSGDGGAGAGTDQGGSGASGDGRNAAGCGQGGSGGCPNPAHGRGGRASAGDPVDVITGRVYTEPAIDLSLPGWMPLRIERAYSSSARHRDVGLGRGWSHSFAWEIELHRRSLILSLPDGTTQECPLPALDAIVRVGAGSLVRRSWGYQLIVHDGRCLAFQQVDGRERRLCLTQIRDRNSNAISLDYRDGALAVVVDSVGRAIRVRRHADGHIAAFEVRNAPSQGRWIAFRSYAYDDEGHLIAAVDAAGHGVRYTYADGILTSYTYPSGLEVSYRYDSQGRCVETWAEHPAGDPSLDDGVPKYLDATTRARGTRHCRIEYGEDGYREVATSRGVRRYFGNGFGKADKAVWNGGVHSYAYDDAGDVIAYTDPAGASWSWERDAAGRILRELDPLGGSTEYRYDDTGQVVEIVDAQGHSVHYIRDSRGNLLQVHDAIGEVVSFTYGSRGELIAATLPNGGVTRLAYDDLGNRVEVVEPSGAVARYQYNYLGRATATLDERGLETRYTYDDRLALTSIRLPDGSVRWFDYTPEGRLSSITEADGRRSELRWAGLGVVHEARRPDGRQIRYRYDREGDLVCIINEQGERHTLLRDSEGRIKEEPLFAETRAE